MRPMKNGYQLRTPSFIQHKGDGFAPEQQRSANKRQRQEREGKREGEENKEEERKGEREGEGYLSWGGTKDFLRRTWHIGKWQFIKVKGETPC